VRVPTDGPAVLLPGRVVWSRGANGALQEERRQRRGAGAVAFAALEARAARNLQEQFDGVHAVGVVDDPGFKMSFSEAFVEYELPGRGQLRHDTNVGMERALIEGRRGKHFHIVSGKHDKTFVIIDRWASKGE